MKTTIHQAKILGHGYEISETGEYLYSYLAGDLTNAYDEDTVDEVSRYMVSVMTGDGENPMAFLVYDRITSVDASYKKTFLLHVQEEPTVNGDTATVVNSIRENSGKMHVQSLLGDVTYSVIGGPGKEFWANGKNYPIVDAAGTPQFPAEDSINEAGWGRIEISPAEQNLTDRLLTVMYVTDLANEDEITRATEIVSESAVGAEIFGKIVMFPKNAAQFTETFSFETRGDGARDYLIAGIASGKWSVTLNGVKIGDYIAEDGDLLCFTADCGNLTLTPAFAPITYELGGGKAGETALPDAYNYGDTFPIPTDIVKFGSEFVGWYTTETFEAGSKFTGITADMTAPIKLYAKWNRLFDVINYVTGDGKINGDYEIKHTVGIDCTLPTDVTAPNAVFLGWYTDPNFSNVISVIPADYPEGDITVYARFVRLYFDYDCTTAAPKIAGNGTIDLTSDGLIWKTPADPSEKGDSNLALSGIGGFSESAATITFDLLFAENPMPFRIRIRPTESNAADTDIFHVRGGAVYLGSDTEPLFTTREATGRRRVTIVMENDNAGLAIGREANASGGSTDGAVSTITVKLYIDGIYAGQTTTASYLTFGDESYICTRKGKSFSSGVETVQFYSSYTVTEETATSAKLANIRVADGAYSVGGRYYLDLGGEKPIDSTYLTNGEVTALPTLKLENATLAGWYTDPALTEASRITSLENLPYGMVIYASIDSDYEDIEYILSGGMIEGDYPSRYLPSEGIDALPEASKKNSVFLGWYADADYTAQVTGIPVGQTGTVTLYARFCTTYYFYDGTTNVPHSGGSYNDSTTAPDGNGYFIWSNPSGNSNMSFSNLAGLSEMSATISFDLLVEESTMPFFVRLRPTERNLADTALLHFEEDGSIKLGSSSEAILSTSELLGKHRFTIVVTSDNAGLEAGLAANVSGENTDNNACKSNFSIRLYIDGELAGESTVGSYLTFRDGYTIKKGGKSCSSKIATVQFQSAFETNPGLPTSARLANLVIADGANPNQ